MGMNTPMNGMGQMPGQGIPGQPPFPPPINPMGQPPPPFIEFRIQEMNHRLTAFFANRVTIQIHILFKFY
jgi:hypothetical protein